MISFQSKKDSLRSILTVRSTYFTPCTVKFKKKFPQLVRLVTWNNRRWDHHRINAQGWINIYLAKVLLLLIRWSAERVSVWDHTVALSWHSKLFAVPAFDIPALLYMWSYIAGVTTVETVRINTMIKSVSGIQLATKIWKVRWKWVWLWHSQSMSMSTLGNYYGQFHKPLQLIRVCILNSKINLQFRL